MGEFTFNNINVECDLKPKSCKISFDLTKY